MRVRPGGGPPRGLVVPLAGPGSLGPVERARRTTLVLTDCDGVLTDGCAYYSARGEELKRFSLRDGMGVERLREAGIESAIVTRERSSAVARRAEKLGLRWHFDGVRDKAAELARVLAETGRTPDQLAFIGDDVNDLALLGLVGREGLTGCPADAMPEVQRAVHHAGGIPGGRGAFREFAEWILRLRREAAAGSRPQGE
jgi:3-deoxy-D-manno-octulosonate 8-phosphate phosphatase (KDO 8-P phosphatase)